MNSGCVQGLDRLGPRQRAVVTGLPAAGDLRRRLMEVGFVPGADVECVLLGRGIAAYRIRGAVIALRQPDAAGIAVQNTPEPERL